MQRKLAISAGNEERPELRSRLFLANPAEHVGTVMACWLSEDSGAMNHAATLGILGGKSEGIDPGQRDGSGAHGARFQRDP